MHPFRVKSHSIRAHLPFPWVLTPKVKKPTKWEVPSNTSKFHPEGVHLNKKIQHTSAEIDQLGVPVHWLSE